jgi:hypothetical protein
VVYSGCEALPRGPRAASGFDACESALSASETSSINVSQIVYLKSRELPVLPVRLTVRIAEFYFTFRPPQEDCDVYAGLCLNEPRSGWSARPRSTRIIDLEQSHEALFGACSKSNRYKIDRARRSDHVQTVFFPNTDEGHLLAFIAYYDSFAATKDLPPIRRDQFTAMASARKLFISGARDDAGALLAAHAYVLEEDRARLTHSASMFRLEANSAERSRIGRVNRLLHWDDMVHFRALGVKAYDMGGWYTGTRDQALLRINAFKKDFGGRVIHEWDLFRPGSTRGWLYLRGRNLVGPAHAA